MSPSIIHISESPRKIMYLVNSPAYYMTGGILGWGHPNKSPAYKTGEILGWDHPNKSPANFTGEILGWPIILLSLLYT